MNICQQSGVCSIQYTILFCHSFSSKEKVSFNFIATVTIHNDFGAQGNKALSLFLLLPIYIFNLNSYKQHGTLKVLQHYNSKASILWRSAFFMIQLLHPYITTGKTIALTIWTFVGKVMSLLFNTLSRFVTAFLPRNIFKKPIWTISVF